LKTLSNQRIWYISLACAYDCEKAYFQKERLFFSSWVEGDFSLGADTSEVSSYSQMWLRLNLRS